MRLKQRSSRADDRIPAENGLVSREARGDNYGEKSVNSNGPVRGGTIGNGT